MNRTLGCLTMGLVLGAGCSGTSSDSALDTPFNDGVEAVMPAFSAVEGLTRLSVKNIIQTSPQTDSVNPLYTTFEPNHWTAGHPLYEVFYLLREFDPEIHQGVIDTSNLYKTMWESRGFFANTKSQCNEIDEVVIHSPFDFGQDSETYTCAFNHVADDGRDFAGAYKESDAAYGLFGFVWDDGHHEEYGVMQGRYADETGDLGLNIAVWVDYSDEADYCYRNDIEGNAHTHFFTFRSVKGNRGSENNYLSILGRGYSRGADKHFLIKTQDSSMETRYYCIGAEDGEAQLQDMHPDGSNEVHENCEEYAENINALEFLTNLDLACDSSDFNLGGTGEAAEGTVLLNF